MNITDIHRYLSGEASPEQAEKFERWLELSDENKRTFEKFQKIYQVDIEPRYRFDKVAALNKFRLAMHTGSARAHRKTEVYSKSPKRRTGLWIKAAAVLIAVFGISIYIITNIESQQPGVDEVVAGITIQTEPGEQKSFKLSDGSRVRLNSYSSIYIPSGFSKNERVVELRGEGFFEIESGHEFEFQVNTRSARITVLGTSFSVRAWEERDESVIAVQQGKVVVGSTNPEISDQTFLTAGQYSQIRAGEAPGPAIEENIEQYLGWTDQVFVFEETPLIDVLHQLELHFDVKITVSDSSSINDPVTARYRSESLSEILRFTSITHGVEFEVESY